MIYTVTFNPSVDYIINVNDIKLGLTNRTISEEYYIGGKGINVSLVLSELDVNSAALGFTAGFTGLEIETSLKNSNITCDFITLKNGFSRINIKIKDKQETEINGQGPDIEESDLCSLFEKLNKIQDGDILMLAGSVPKSLSSDIYEKICQHLQHKNVKIIVDATKDLLLNILKYKPFLIKPNNFELAEIFETTINSDDYETIIKYAKKLQEMGALNVLVSLAENGSVLIDENGEIHKQGVANVPVVNSVGAGDSMVAGFIAGYLSKNDYNYALKLGTACGGATTALKGLATKEKIDELLQKLQL